MSVAAEGRAHRSIEQVARRSRQARDLVRADGVRGAAARVFAGAARRLHQPPVLASIRDVDVLQADLRNRFEPPVPPLGADGSMTINWVMPPPGPNSGGHTTSFRLIRHLEQRGHTSRVYFYDVYGADLDYFAALLKQNYADVPVADVVDGMDDAHAVFATCWESAYPVYNARCAGRRFYLVQDFEPWFYPASASAALAENTYRMGFHAITAGAWLADRLRTGYDMDADHFDFGCDTDVYTCGDEVRDGIVFYARPKAPRRAYELCLLTLRLFAEQHPDVAIHAYGDHVGDVGFAVVDHGLVSPATLNSIYNRSFAGLCLSMSNVSLVPHEMLAAGCIPVVNDAEHNRIVLDNDHVVYTEPDPHHLAAALGAIVTDADFEARAERAAASVTGASWEQAGADVEAALVRALADGEPIAR